MKKKLIFAAAAIAMLASCSQNDELTQPTVAQNENTPVSFGTYIGRQVQTRSGISGDIDASASALAAKDGFGVFAYYTGSSDWSTVETTATPNFMYNEHVTSANSGTTWTYSPIKYWPNQYNNGDVDAANPANEADEATAASNAGKVSFFAYAPYVSVTAGAAANTAYGITALSTNDATGHPTATYKLAKGQQGSEGNDFVDLLWGVKVNGAKEATPTTDTYNVDLTKNSANLTSADKDGKVSFLFKHALTKVGGSDAMKIVYDIDGNGTGETGAGSDDANTLVTVGDITIKNVENKIINEGTFDLATGTWNTTSLATVAEGAAINLHFTPTGGGDDIQLNSAIAETTPAYSTGAWTTPTGGGVKAATAKDVYASTGKSIYFIPGTQDQQLKVTITYTVRTYDDKLATSASGGEGTWTKVTQTISNIVTLPTSLIKSNKKITLVIHLGLTSVKFTANVDSWEDVDGSDAEEIWLPSNVVPAVTP